MSAAAAYLERDDLGLRVARIQLVGVGAQDQWTPTADSQAAGPIPDLTAAAEWIGSRLVPAGSAAGRLELLCLDPDGSLCSWLTTASTQPEVVGVLARQSGGSMDGTPGGERAMTPLTFYAATPAEAGVQALSHIATAPVVRKKKGVRAAAPVTDRIAVLATSDATVRLLIDELDGRGVQIGSVVSLWQAMAAAWDPSGPARGPSPFPGLASRADAKELVESAQETCTAVVLADPRGRLHWCWCAGGKLIAAGTIRVRVAHAPAAETRGAIVEADAAPDSAADRASVVVGAEDAARLTSHWLAWSVQLARAPSRIVCVMPQNTAAAGGEAADPGMLGRTLGASWPGASVDVAVLDDPIGMTLLKLVDRNQPAGDALASTDGLVTLTGRPTRTHRRFYVWAAGAVLLAAAGLGAAALQLQRSAGQIKATARTLRVNWEDQVKAIYPPALLSGPQGMILDLEAQLTQKKKELLPPDRAEPAMPVLQELDTLSMVLGVEGFQLKEIYLDSRARPEVVVVADGVKTLEAIQSALNGIAGSRVGSWNFNARPVGQGGTKLEGTFNASWSDVGTRPMAPGGSS